MARRHGAHARRCLFRGCGELREAGVNCDDIRDPHALRARAANIPLDHQGDSAKVQEWLEASLMLLGLGPACVARKRRLCSVSCRWRSVDVLTLTAIKQSFGAATDLVRAAAM